MYTAYELTSINHVTMNTEQIMMMPQPDYIYWVGHLAKAVKKKKKKKFQLLFTLLLPHIWQQQIMPPNNRCHYTHLTYVTEQIWLPCCKYDSHSNYVKWAYRPNTFAYIHQNTTNCNSYFTNYCQVCASQDKQQTATLIYYAKTIYIPTTIRPLKCHEYATYAYYFLCMYEMLISVYYVPYMS